ncbi:MAG: aspartyl protease family protein [Parvularculaceae bacterium]|nr:aspartyl protease family protein [Parvularculaceae bacterium]
MLRLLLILLLTAAAGLARAATPLVEIPYCLDYRGWFTISATIAGKGPFDFVVDTGATRTLIFVNVVDRIGGVAPSGGPPVSVLGLSSSEKFPTFFVGDIAVGTEKLVNLRTVVLRDWTVGGRAPQGVLGLDFLARYKVEIDAERSVMRFYAPDADLQLEDRRGWRAAPMTRRPFNLDEGALYVVTVRLNSFTVPVLLDTGAASTLVNGLAAARGATSSIRTTASDWTGSARVTDALSSKGRAGVARFDRMRIGEARWTGVDLVVFDADIFAELGVANRPYGLLGANLFERRSVIFDFPGERIIISPDLGARKKP